MKPTPHATIRLLMFTLALTVSLISISGAQVWEDSVEIASGETANYVSQHHPLKRVIVGDPDMVHVDVIAKDEIVLVGRQMGQSKILLRDNMDNTTTLNVFVSPDVSLLKRRIHQLFPNQDIKIYSNANGVILGGTVTGAEIIEQVLRVASQILVAPTGEGPKPIKIGEGVAKSASREELATVIAQKQTISARADDGGGGAGTGESSPQIINLMKVGGPQQVMLEVKFAEVNRDSTRDMQAAFKLGGLSSDFGGAIGVSPFGVGGGGAAPSLPSLAGDLFVNLAGLADNANVFLNINKFSLAMRFLEEEGMARLLAEPRLVTLSGQEASFLAGGEYPYQTVSDSDVSIGFKEYGVGLTFTPIVGSDGMVTLRVSPSVSDIDRLVQTSTGPQPILVTRKLNTTVRLRDGQTLVLAGLLQDNLRENIEKLPFLGDIPILGALFRSSFYEERKTDLLVSVTPHIVKPVREGSISFPGEFVKKPSRLEFYLEGRLEGRRTPEDPSLLSQHNFSAATASDGGGMEGDFGQTDEAQ
ncbi:pilus assembly protein N-terminal domain-containing protein [Deltaproteobacteria bacterium IMCC39524]|nr:pilus assembly protein N-terminal domain-containing protein [Deltaproteobacteria bacterium IMCC39524]